MMKTAIIGYPYIGKNREWKKIVEKFYEQELVEQEFYLHMQELQFNHLAKQHVAGIDVLTIGDFTFYDRVLDLAWMFNLVPKRFRHLTGLDSYYAMACDGQEPCGMEKWFTTNYHYVVPEFDGQALQLAHNPLVEQVLQVRARFGKIPRVTLIGPYTFIQLTKGLTKETKGLFVEQLVAVYRQLFMSLQNIGVEWIQLEEPALTKDLRKVDLVELREIYDKLTADLVVKIMLTTYFGGVQKLSELLTLPVTGFGLDIVAGYEENMEQLATLTFPENKVLSLGIIDGQNIWCANLVNNAKKIKRIKQLCKTSEIWIQSSCHLQHVPVTKQGDVHLFRELYDVLAFADEKIEELVLLKELISQQSTVHILMMNKNEQQLNTFATYPSRKNHNVVRELAQIEEKNLKRVSSFARRKRLQQLFLELPTYPTTIVNGFSQSKKMQELRKLWRRGELTEEQYEIGKGQEIARRIYLQEQIGLDVFLYEQVERTNMVEYLADKLDGIALTQKGWVISHGTSCSKPPIIYGDVAWSGPMLVQEAKLAQQKTAKRLKCKLTGPTTLFNWSFARQDMEQQQIILQLAFALRKEVKALEGAGIYILQIDEPALIESLPLRKGEQRLYVQNSIDAFKLTTAVVRDTTQIHAHLFYQESREFNKVVSSIDADVLSVEASNKEVLFLAYLQQKSYKFGIGFGMGEGRCSVEREKIMSIIQKRTSLVAKDQFWLTPDIDYKNRKEEEAVEFFTVIVETVNKMKKYY